MSGHGSYDIAMPIPVAALVLSMVPFFHAAVSASGGDMKWAAANGGFGLAAALLGAGSLSIARKARLFSVLRGKIHIGKHLTDGEREHNREMYELVASELSFLRAENSRQEDLLRNYQKQLLNEG